jgi:hypothetical protein
VLATLKDILAVTVPLTFPIIYSLFHHRVIANTRSIKKNCNLSWLPHLVATYTCFVVDKRNEPVCTHRWLVRLARAAEVVVETAAVPLPLSKAIERKYYQQTPSSRRVRALLPPEYSSVPQMLGLGILEGGAAGGRP